MINNFVSIVGDMQKFEYDKETKTISLEILTENGEEIFPISCYITLNDENRELFDNVARLKKEIFKLLRVEGSLSYAEEVEIEISAIEKL